MWNGVAFEVVKDYKNGTRFKMKNVSISPLVLVGVILALIVSLGALLYTQRVVEDSPRGFVLPAGDPVKGKQAFTDLGCVNCHSVYGETFSTEPSVNSEWVIPLGGELPMAMSYGRLVTSIIHPSESTRASSDVYIGEDGESLMPEYKSVMTVEQMADLVDFLQDHYEVVSIHDYGRNTVPYP